MIHGIIISGCIYTFRFILDEVPCLTGVKWKHIIVDLDSVCLCVCCVNDSWCHVLSIDMSTVYVYVT